MVGLTHRPTLLGGHHTEAALEDLFQQADLPRMAGGKGIVVQKAAGTDKPEQAKTKATAWASRLHFRYPAQRTDLEALGIRDAGGALAMCYRPRRLGVGHAWLGAIVAAAAAALLVLAIARQKARGVRRLLLLLGFLLLSAGWLLPRRLRRLS